MTLTASTAHCDRCGATFRVPNRLPRKALNALAITHADGRRMAFIKQLRDAGGFTLEEAKGLLQHITHDARCHWCSNPIPVTAIAACSCGAINIDLTMVE